MKLMVGVLLLSLLPAAPAAAKHWHDEGKHWNKHWKNHDDDDRGVNHHPLASVRCEHSSAARGFRARQSDRSTKHIRPRTTDASQAVDCVDAIFPRIHSSTILRSDRFAVRFNQRQYSGARTLFGYYRIKAPGR